MAVRRRARADQAALRVNAAAELLSQGLEAPEAARALARRYRVSERQARRYLERAVASGQILVPAPKKVFTVKLEEAVGRRIRGYARSVGRPISEVVSEALEEFLDQRRAGPRGGASTSRD
jgi:hypothetical protein